MERVEGRTDAFVQVPSGQIFSPIIWTVLLRRFYDIAQFRVTQEKIDRIKIQVKPRSDLTRSTIEQITENVRKILGKEVHINVEPVDEIPRDNSGKVRSVISKVEIDWGEAW